MGHVTISLNGRSYRLRCGDGEEARIEQLAAYVGERLDKLTRDFGQQGDERLLVMVTLFLADELLDLKSKQNGAAAATLDAGAADANPEDEGAKPTSLPHAATTATAGSPATSAKTGTTQPPPLLSEPATPSDAAAAPGATPPAPVAGNAPISPTAATPALTPAKTASPAQPETTGLRRPTPSRISLEARLAEARGRSPRSPEKPEPDAA